MNNLLDYSVFRLAGVTDTRDGTGNSTQHGFKMSDKKKISSYCNRMSLTLVLVTNPCNLGFSNPRKDPGCKTLDSSNLANMPSGSRSEKEKIITVISGFGQREEKTSVQIKGGFRGHLS